MTKFIS